jgi:hypothetical protein
MSGSASLFKWAVLIGLGFQGGVGNAMTSLVSSGQPPQEAAPVHDSSQRVLTDLTLTSETTLDEIIALWGEPVQEGPAGEISQYRLASGEQLWLSFTDAEPRRLTRAVLLSDSVAPTARVLLNNLEITRRRRMDQLDFLRPLSAKDVYAAWGPPDSAWGSGLARWEYALADGDSTSLAFERGEVLGSGRRGRPGTPEYRGH